MAAKARGGEGAEIAADLRAPAHAPERLERGIVGAFSPVPTGGSRPKRPAAACSSRSVEVGAGTKGDATGALHPGLGGRLWPVDLLDRAAVATEQSTPRKA